MLDRDVATGSAKYLFADRRSKPRKFESLRQCTEALLSLMEWLMRLTEPA